MFFFGQYEHTIDAKQRLAIPADARAVLDASGTGGTLVAAPGEDDSINLWPERTFAEFVQASLSGAFLGDARLARLQKQLFADAKRCPLDSAGRIRLPEHLLAKYGLSGSVMVVGAMDHLEVIDAARWKEEQATAPGFNELLTEARQALAERAHRNPAS